MSYSEKHSRRNTSPILRTTSEDRKPANKDNYIQYLEQQLEQSATIMKKKYEDRLHFVEDVIQEHEEKFENFIKLIKLLQHFAETQEQENNNIKNHFNQSMDKLYNNEIKSIKQQMNQIEQSQFELKQISFREQPIIQELEQQLNKKIDVIMDEIRQSALKTDFQQLELKLKKFEANFKQESQIKQVESDRILNNLNNSITYQQQIDDLKFVIDSLIQDQEQQKNSQQKLQNDLISFQRSYQSQTNIIPIKPTKNSVQREQIEMDQRPIRELKENLRRPENGRKKSKSSQSRSESRNARLETIKKKKQDSVKELIKKHKQQSSQKH